MHALGLGPNTAFKILAAAVSTSMKGLTGDLAIFVSTNPSLTLTIARPRVAAR